MEWYEKWFGEEYKLLYPHRNEAEAKQQVNFLLRQIDLPKGSKILDLCCGCGRHSVELKLRGYDVIGLDLSVDLLEMACSRASECNLDINFIRCDMREIPYKNQFDLIVNFFTSFGYFMDDRENYKVLLSISKALKSNGKFLIDYMNPDHVMKNIVEKDEKNLPHGLKALQERWIDITANRINKKIILVKDGEERIFNESVRMYNLGEMKEMLLKAGLNLKSVYGDFTGSEYNSDSPRMVLIGEKILDKK